MALSRTLLALALVAPGALCSLVPIALGVTLEGRTAASVDDAEEFSTGVMYTASSDLELIHDNTDQTVGMRWRGLSIPRGATITAAWIQFSAKEAQSEATSLTFRGQASDAAAPFDTVVFNITTRPLTVAATQWAPGPWLAGESGPNQRTPDLSAVVQEIVNRPGWVSGNPLAVLVTGSGHRTAWSWDGLHTAAPLLHVEYVSAPGPPPSEAVAVYVGFCDTHHEDNPKPKPWPWMYAPGVVFAGAPDTPCGGWDTSALRLDNLTGQTLSNVVVTADIGDVHYALWGPRSIPAGWKLILAQTAPGNFDGSSTNVAGCEGCDPTLCMTAVKSTIPVVHVTIGGVTAYYLDSEQVLNTHGVDAEGCPYTGGRNDESEQWRQVLPSPDPTTSVAPRADGALALAPPTPNPARGSLTLQFRLPSEGHARLVIYDVAGRVVRTCVDRTLRSGEYRRAENIAGLKPGVYFCDLRAPGGRARTTFVVAR